MPLWLLYEEIGDAYPAARQTDDDDDEDII